MNKYSAIKRIILNRLSHNQKSALRKLIFKVRRLCSPDSAKALKRMVSLVSERPVKIIVETYSLCNSRCVFCARRKLKASKQLMSIELFEKICKEYNSLGGGFLGFSPLMADPLLDPLLFDRVRIINKRYPSIHPHMFTNGIAFAALSDASIVELLTALDHIDISIGGLNRHDYKTMFGVDQFEKVYKSLFRVSRLNKQYSCNCRLGLHVRTHRKKQSLGSPELGKLIKDGYKCNDVLDSFSDWGGMVTDEDLPRGATLIRQDNTKCSSTCLIPMTYMAIMPDGRVLGCGCMDGKEDTFVGQLDEASLVEIWKGKRFTALRESFKDGNLFSLCQKCSFYSGYEDLFCRPGLKDFDPSMNFWECV